MKIVMTDTTTKQRKIVTFDEVCKTFEGKVSKTTINYWLLDGVMIKNGNYQYRRKISQEEVKLVSLV